MRLAKGLLAVSLFWLALATPSLAQLSDQHNIIQVWSYYESLPFKTDNAQSGLSKDFVGFLNSQAKGQYRFKLNIIPRKRLDYYLQEQHQGIVIFVNWSWMGKGAKDKYFWSHPILHDRNEIVSSSKNPVQYDGPNSLKGLSFAAIHGRHYLGLNELMAQGLIKRHDVYNENAVLMLIESGRAQVTSMAKTLLMPHIKKLHLQGKLFISDKALFEFTRHIMTPKSFPIVHEFVQDVTHNINNKPEWQAILEKYGLNKNK